MSKLLFQLKECAYWNEEMNSIHVQIIDAMGNTFDGTLNIIKTQLEKLK